MYTMKNEQVDNLYYILFQNSIKILRMGAYSEDERHPEAKVILDLTASWE